MQSRLRRVYSHSGDSSVAKYAFFRMLRTHPKGGYGGPRSRLRWRPFADLCVHPFHLAALVVGVDARVRATRIDQAVHGPRVDELTSLAGRKVDIAPTFLDVDLLADDRPFRIVAAKFATPQAMERALKLEYEYGEIVCDLDARSLGMHVTGKQSAELRVKPGLLPYEVPLRLFQGIGQDSPDERAEMLRPDTLTYQLAGLTWWFEVCKAAATETVRRVEAPVRLPERLLDQAGHKRLARASTRG
jgi:hypothetical protein